jgi:ATP-dependent exoDNAse (exonuclease V) beta subunit
LAQLLAGDQANLTAAADPNQSIYGFRGADPDNVSRLLPSLTTGGRQATIYVLGRSLRVPGEILDSARRLVEANGPALDAGDVAPAGHDGQVEAYTFDQRSAEAEWIAAEIETLRVVEGVPLDQMAVLVRSTRHLLPELSRALDRRGIVHDRPDTRLVDHPAIRLISDVVAAGVSPDNSREAELAVRRLLLGPLLALPLARERELNRLGRISSMPWHRLISEELPDATALADLIADPGWATDLPAVEGFWHLWDRLPGLDRLVLDPDRHDYRIAWATFARLLDRQSERDDAISLAAYLEAASTGDFEASPQLRHVRHDDERLVVTTLHQAKGLEFDVVFIADAVEGVFPDSRRSRSLLQTHMLGAPTDLTGREVVARRLREERRLAYTASTRARRRVVWTATTAGIDESERRPSRFILAAAGVASFDEIRPPQAGADTDEFAPVSLLDAEARLRRLLLDPEAAAPRRLAALSTLVTSPYWDPAGFAGVAEPGPDSGLVDSGLRLSPSQADSYQKCPRRYALERRLRALDFDSPYATFGSLVHEVLENTEKQAAEHGHAHGDLTSALEELDRVWDRYPPFGPPPLDDAWKRRAVQFLEQMYLDWPGGDDPPIALEIELRTRVGDTDWVGRADRIDRAGAGLKVVDYKSSKNPPPLKEVATSLQLGYYALAAAEHPELVHHGPPVAAELWFPLAKRRDKVFPFDMSNLDHIRTALADVAAGIRSEDWTPRVGSHCGRCEFRGVCPAWPEGREGFR